MSQLINFFADNTSLLISKTISHLGISAMALMNKFLGV